MTEAEREHRAELLAEERDAYVATDRACRAQGGYMVIKREGSPLRKSYSRSELKWAKCVRSSKGIW